MRTMGNRERGWEVQPSGVDLAGMVDEFIGEHPELAAALEVFGISEREYAEACAALNDAHVIHSGTSNLDGWNGELGGSSGGN